MGERASKELDAFAWDVFIAAIVRIRSQRAVTGLLEMPICMFYPEKVPKYDSVINGEVVPGDSKLSCDLPKSKKALKDSERAKGPNPKPQGRSEVKPRETTEPAAGKGKAFKPGKGRRPRNQRARRPE